MSFVDFLVLLVVAGICGALAQAIIGYSRGGCLVSIAIGLVGALVGMGLARLVGLPEILPVAGFPVVWSIVGSALFVFVLGLLSRRTA